MDGHQKQREASAHRIEGALFELMKTKEFSRITISELSERADVSRRTFYRLYREKEDVLHGYFDRLCQTYRSRYPALTHYDIRKIARDYFGFWYEYRELLLLLHKSGLEEMLYYEISRVSVSVVQNRIESSKQKNEEDITYFAKYSVGGFILLLHQWIQKGIQPPPDQYADIVSNSIIKYMHIPAKLRKK